MMAVLTAIHVLDCVALILVVLLQAGRGAGLASVFGASSGGGTGAIFGGRGAEGFLSKATAVLAIVFMVTSISLSVLSGRRSTPRSVLMEEARRAAQDAVQPIPAAGVPGGEAGQVLPPLELPAGGQETPTEPEAQPEGN